ncbi:MAG: hypothetical protein EOO01_22195 [Chitinophagaceae bacterium]|nr:MAG: hypothetical protein EOO01_22195 [Chitinophagaceae bacterium]
MMRTLATLLLVSGCLLATPSCKKEETEEKLIYGFWEHKYDHTVTYTDGVVTQDTTYSYADDESIYEFRTDGTFVWYHLGIPRKLYYTMTVDSMEIFDNPYAYKLDGDRLVIVGGNEKVEQGKSIKTIRSEYYDRQQK